MKDYSDRQPHSVAFSHVPGGFGSVVPHSRFISPLASPSPAILNAQPVRPLLAPPDLFQPSTPAALKHRLFPFRNHS